MFVFELVLAALAPMLGLDIDDDDVASDAGSFRPGLLLDAPAVEVC